MKIIEDEVIGELRYLTVEIDQIEFTAATGGPGVISQDAVKRYFIEKRPDLKVKKCGGIKINHQDRTITMRVGIVNTSTIEEDFKRIKTADNGDIVPVSPGFMKHQKLLNPGYDEVQQELDKTGLALLDAVKETEELKEKCDELQHEKDIVGRLYDALVIAVGKDAQKFSDLLVENEELKDQLTKLQKEKLNGIIGGKAPE